MSVTDIDDPPACPCCNSASRVSYSASWRSPGGELVPEFACRPCGRAFVASESPDDVDAADP